MTRLLLAALLVTAGGCVRGQYTRVTINVPIEEGAVASLTPGTGLQPCLDTLGAPIRIWETEDGGFAMAYGWLSDRGWGVSASYSITTLVSVSLTYDDQFKKLEGAVLWFDQDWQLLRARMGLLSDLIPARRRPVDVELLEQLQKEKAASQGG